MVLSPVWVFLSVLCKIWIKSKYWYHTDIQKWNKNIKTLNLFYELLSVCALSLHFTSIIQNTNNPQGIKLKWQDCFENVNKLLLCQCVFVLGGDVGLQVCSCLRCDRSVAGDVQEDQIKSNKVSDEPEQHHRVPPKPVALIQHPEDAPSWSNRAERGNGRLSLCPATLLRSATRQRTHLRSRLFRCKCPRFRLNSLHLCQTASWLRYTSRTPRCRKWAPNLTEQSARIRLIQFGLTSTWTRLTLTHLCTRWRGSAASSLWCQTFYML